MQRLTFTISPIAAPLPGPHGALVVAASIAPRSFAVNIRHYRTRWRRCTFAALKHEAGTLAALARLEEAQAALHERLRPVDLAVLHERPPSGEWSPMENVRHLIFAEQHHFSPYLPGFRWKSVGVPPPNRTGERRLSPAGSDPASTIAQVFEVWAKVHAVVRARCLQEPDGLVRSIEGDLHHLTIHARTIERLLQR